MILEGTVNEPATVTVGGQPAQVWGIGNGQYGWRGTAQVAAGVTNSVPVVARDSSYTGADATNIAEHQTTRTAQVQAGGVAIPSLLYDDNGNLIRENRAGGSYRTFHWDAANRLVKIVDGATTTEWRYNGFDQRMEEKVNGAVTAKWRWDGTQLREMIVGTTLRKYFVRGMQWTPNTAQAATTSNYFFFRDHLGSLREMIDASGNLHKRYAYDLWGRRTQPVNTTTVPEPMLGFTGHFYHAGTGLHLAFYRAYSAELGRWLSMDPIEEEGGLNLYRLVENDPINRFDSLGLKPSYKCCNAKKRGAGASQLLDDAAQYKKDLESGVKKRVRGFDKPSCINDHSNLINALNIPPCWECRVECGWSTIVTRTAGGAGDWREHCVVICRSRDTNGKLTGQEIILDITGGYKSVSDFRLDFPGKHPDTYGAFGPTPSCEAL